jgi:hypothetical protein
MQIPLLMADKSLPTRRTYQHLTSGQIPLGFTLALDLQKRNGFVHHFVMT